MSCSIVRSKSQVSNWRNCVLYIEQGQARPARQVLWIYFTQATQRSWLSRFCSNQGIEENNYDVQSKPACKNGVEKEKGFRHAWLVYTMLARRFFLCRRSVRTIPTYARFLWSSFSQNSKPFFLLLCCSNLSSSLSLQYMYVVHRIKTFWNAEETELEEGSGFFVTGLMLST